MAKKATKMVETATTHDISISAEAIAHLANVVAATNANSFVYASAIDNHYLLAHDLVEVNTAMTDENGAVATRATPKGISYMSTVSATKEVSAEVENNTFAPAVGIAPATPIVTQPTPAPIVTKAKFEIDDYVPPNIGQRRPRNGGSMFRFDELEVNKSIHVPVSADRPTPADVAAATGPSASAANDRYSVGTGVMETVTVHEYARDTYGKFMKDENGKRIKTGSRQEQREKKTLTRQFVVKPVGTEDPRGPGARIVRIK